MRGDSSKDEPLKHQWQKPDLSLELGEIERTAEETGIPLEKMVAAFDTAELQELSDEDWESMINCDSRDPSWQLDEIREHLKNKRDFERIEQGMKAGDTFPAPVVLYRENQPPYLIGGNSRLLGCRALGLRPTVLALRLESES